MVTRITTGYISVVKFIVNFRINQEINITILSIKILVINVWILCKEYKEIEDDVSSCNKKEKI